LDKKFTDRRRGERRKIVCTTCQGKGWHTVNIDHGDGRHSFDATECVACNGLGVNMKDCLLPIQTVNDYDALYKAWQEIGADIVGLSWSQFVSAIERREKS
jgi:hypothetical protein